MSKLKNEKGFTLLETVISIAALAFLSVFILQMFIVSANGNLKAQNMDISASMAMGTIETFKVCKSPDEFFQREEMKNAFWDETTKAGRAVTFCYDKNWKTVLPGDARAIKYVITTRVMSQDPGKDEAGYLANIYVRADAVKSGEVFSQNGLAPDDQLLVEYDTVKYFSNR